MDVFAHPPASAGGAQSEMLRHGSWLASDRPRPSERCDAMRQLFEMIDGRLSQPSRQAMISTAVLEVDSVSRARRGRVTLGQQARQVPCRLHVDGFHRNVRTCGPSAKSRSVFVRPLLRPFVPAWLGVAEVHDEPTVTFDTYVAYTDTCPSMLLTGFDENPSRTGDGGCGSLGILEVSRMSEQIISASRILPFSPEEIFEVLATPAGHVEMDGSGTVTGVAKGPDRLFEGAKFKMKMRIGVPYQMASTVKEFEENRRIHGHTSGARCYQLEPVEGGTRSPNL